MPRERDELRNKVLKELKNVIDPEVGLSVVDMGLIKDIQIEDNKATIKMTLTVPSFMCPLARYLMMQVREVALKIDEIDDVEVVLIEPFEA